MIERSRGTAQAEAPTRRLGLRTATMLVVASMVGSGVFTTTGFLLRDLGSAPAVLTVWLLGGVLATCGALAYAELTAALPENGGEYALLSRIYGSPYGPALGFLSGWVSLVVGFSAPIAAAAMAFGAYTERVLPVLDRTALAVGLIGASSVLHAVRVRLGGRVQDAVTLLDLLLIGAFVAAGLAMGDLGRLTAEGWTSIPTALGTSTAAVGLVYVSYSYSGWNAAAYVAGEVRDPRRTLPRALLLGTSLVTVLYLALNAVYLAGAPPAALSGQLEVAHVAAEHLLGPVAAPWVSGLVAVGLATSVGALTMTGPRIYERMGQDHARLRTLAVRRGRGGPVRAVVLQTVVALLLAVTSTYDALLTYIGFTLALSSGLTVAGVFVLRRREPDLERPYRVWGHPVTTALALLLMGWMVALTLVERPLAALAGVGTLAAGLLVYRWLSRPA